jgi:hypothetical protein
MQGHVMPSFPHTLIGLDPFANLGCQTVFTKMAVSVIHPEGHIILEGWREQDGPCLWRFPLKANKPSLPVTTLTENYEEPGPRGSAANFFTLPLTSPIQCPAALPLPVPACLLTPAPMVLPENYEELGPCGSAAIFFMPPLTSPIQCPDAIPLPVPARPLTLAPPAQTHPSQGCLAIDEAGQACSVTYMYGAAQALALAAQASNTTFDPQSLNLPSMGALVGFYHACLGFPVKQTWLNAIKAGNCDSFEGLTYCNAARYCQDADETILGHLA